MPNFDDAHVPDDVPSEPGDIGGHPLGMALLSALHDAEQLGG